MWPKSFSSAADETTHEVRANSRLDIRTGTSEQSTTSLVARCPSLEKSVCSRPPASLHALQTAHCSTRLRSEVESDCVAQVSLKPVVLLPQILVLGLQHVPPSPLNINAPFWGVVWVVETGFHQVS